jgi:hypothetical protein
MAGIWDIPPPPQFGDATDDITFASVGRALTRWGQFEVHFASFFSALIGTEDNSAAAIHSYGSVISFRGRADLVRAVAEIHFSIFPDVDLEKQFQKFVNELTNQACARRNEIAHGIVVASPIVVAQNNTVRRQFFLYPPYASNKMQLDRVESTDGRQMAWYKPKYTYTSVEIDLFAKGFSGLLPRLAVVMGPMLARKKAQPTT